MICPKCSQEFEPTKKHGYVSKYCSRSCANSRSWSIEDKKTKSEAALSSDKVREANVSVEKRKNVSKKISTLHKEGKLKPPTDEARKNAVASNKRRAKERLDGLNVSEKKQYRDACQFRFSLNRFDDEFDFELVKKYGWYKAPNRGNNPKGVSRDHKMSIEYGWNNNVPPEKIRHPANCELMRHDHNWNKRGKSSVTESELDLLIENWNKKWGMG